LNNTFSVEYEHCKELAMPPGSLFEFTSRFVPDGQLQQLMSVYALINTLSSIPLASTDDSVKWAKIKWWSEELAADPSSPARHPILRAMFHSGAREKLDISLLQRLVSDAVMQMDVLPDSDKATLFERLAVQGESDIRLELALAGVEMESLSHFSPGINSPGLGTGLFNMISAIRGNYRDGINFLPLDMLAQHRVSAANLQQFPPQPELLTIITQLAGFGIEAYDKGLPVPLTTAPGLPTHLQLRWAMETRCLTRISKKPESIFGKGNDVGPSDAWFAWVYCRRASRMRRGRAASDGVNTSA
jgi:phytoene/squalene synthetase